MWPPPSHGYRLSVGRFSKGRSGIPQTSPLWHFSSQSTVTAITDVQLGQCDNDTDRIMISKSPAKPERCLQEDSRSSGPVLFDKPSCSAKCSESNARKSAKSPPKSPQNGNLGRKSDLSPYLSSR